MGTTLTYIASEKMQQMKIRSKLEEKLTSTIKQVNQKHLKQLLKAFTVMATETRKQLDENNNISCFRAKEGYVL